MEYGEYGVMVSITACDAVGLGSRPNIHPNKEICIMNLKERFEKNFIKEDGCWNWLNCSRGNGYGAIKINNKVVDSHRASYIIYKGEIKLGMLVCHTCDNRKCVNPDHLFLGTHKDNYNDAIKKSRIIKLDRKCIFELCPSNASYVRGCRCRGCKDAHAKAEYGYRNKKS